MPGFDPRSRKIPLEEDGYLLQYSYLEEPWDRGEGSVGSARSLACLTEAAAQARHFYSILISSRTCNSIYLLTYEK